MTDTTWQTYMPPEIYHRYVEPCLTAPAPALAPTIRREPAPAPINVVDPKQRPSR
jgi:hypothetical protein